MLKGQGQGQGVSLLQGMAEIQEHEVKATGLQRHHSPHRQVHPIHTSHADDVLLQMALMNLDLRCGRGFSAEKPVGRGAPVPDFQVHGRSGSGEGSLIPDLHHPWACPWVHDLKLRRTGLRPATEEAEEKEEAQRVWQPDAHASKFMRLGVESIPWHGVTVHGGSLLLYFRTAGSPRPGTPVARPVVPTHGEGSRSVASPRPGPDPGRPTKRAA